MTTETTLSPALQALQAIVQTVDQPSIENILADIELAHTLITEFKANMSNLHPSVGNILKALF